MAGLYIVKQTCNIVRIKIILYSTAKHHKVNLSRTKQRTRPSHATRLTRRVTSILSTLDACKMQWRYAKASASRGVGSLKDRFIPQFKKSLSAYLDPKNHFSVPSRCEREAIASLYRVRMEAVFIRTPAGGNKAHRPVIDAGGGERIFCRLSLRGGDDCGKRREWK